MKKYFRAVLAILILTVLSGGIVGCDFETQYSKNLKRIFETEYFRCINYEGEDTVTILELTELGKQQEVLVIPKEINGYRVNRIGGEIRGSTLLYGAPKEYFVMTFPKTKKVYFLTELEYASIRFSERDIDDDIVIVTMYRIPNYVFKTFPLCSVEDYGDTSRIEPTIRYYTDSDTTGTSYWIDIVNNDYKEYVLPDSPEREGYEFVCWCTDIGCETVWDGIYDFSGKEQKFYAKWTQA